MYARATTFWQLLHEVVRITNAGTSHQKRMQVNKLFW